MNVYTKEQIKLYDLIQRGKVKELVQYLKKEEYANDAKSFLLEINSEDTIKPLLKMAKSKLTSPRIKCLAIEILGSGYSKSEEIPKALMKTIQDKNNRVRSTSIWALGNLKYKSSLNVLHSMLKDKDEEIRNMSVCSVGDIGDKSSVPFLLDLIKDPSNKVRFTVLQALIQYGSKELYEPMLKILEDENEEDDIKQRARYVLAGIKDIKSQEAVLSHLQDENEVERVPDIGVIRKIAMDSWTQRNEIQPIAVKKLIAYINSYQSISRFSEVDTTIDFLADAASKIPVIDYIIEEMNHMSIMSSGIIKLAKNAMKMSKINNEVIDILINQIEMYANNTSLFERDIAVEIILLFDELKIHRALNSIIKLSNISFIKQEVTRAIRNLNRPSQTL